MGNDNQSGSADDQSKQPGGAGNFGNDRPRTGEAGRKGAMSQGGGSGQSEQSGSGRSQQGGVKRDDDDESLEESGKAGS